jgi:hypothetical protein
MRWLTHGGREQDVVIEEEARDHAPGPVDHADGPRVVRRGSLRPSSARAHVTASTSSAVSGRPSAAARVSSWARTLAPMIVRVA